MKVMETKIQKDGDKITKASVTWENELATNEVKNEDFPYSQSKLLVDAVNELHKIIVDSNAKDGKVRFERMNNFYGNDLTITIKRNI